MRLWLTAAVAALAVTALSGNAFAGAGCSGPKGQHRSAETAETDAVSTVEAGKAAAADQDAWSAVANVGTSLGMAGSVTAHNTVTTTAVSKTTMTKKTMAESTN